MRPRVAVLALVGLLLGQTLAPCGILLSSVHAKELRLKSQESAVPSSKTQIPAWAKELEKRAAQQQREQKLRLAQFNRPVNESAPESVPVEDLDCLDCEVDLKPLDLSEVPTEKALRRAGGVDGALYPMRRAEPEELGIKLDRLLKRLGVEGGLRGELPPRDPRFAALKRAKERYERARAINMLFGRAVKTWRGGERSQAAELFKRYMEMYPRSPWSGEAALHLGYTAKNDGRLLDASDIFHEVLEKTSNKSNKKLRQQKRERKARGVDVTDAEREADIDKALVGVASFEEAVSKLDSSEESDEDDESFEIHMKAKQQLADIEMAMGHYNDASAKLVEMMKEDTDWHRRVWARTQLQRASFLKENGASLMACGPQALGMMMVGLHKNAEAKKVRAAVAKNVSGFSMAELQTLAAKNGVKLRGFRADVNQMSKLALPAILHYDYGSDSKANDKASGHFVVLQGVDSKGEAVRLFDPLNKKSLRLSYSQLKRQWSGKGLAVATSGVRPVSVALDAHSMEAAVGSSTTFPSVHDIGDTDNNSSVGLGDGVNAPAVSINGASLNMHVQHSLINYQPAQGPAVDISLFYNSDSTDSYQYGFDLPSAGRKWSLSCNSSASNNSADFPLNSPGSLIYVQMPDGSAHTYHWVGPKGEYEGGKGNFTKLWCSGQGYYKLEFPDGSEWDYRPAYSGTASLEAMEDTWGRRLTIVYADSWNDFKRISEIVDADGRSTKFSYTVVASRRLVSSITDPFNRTVILSYDTKGNLTQVTDKAGRAFFYSYNAEFSDITTIQTPKVNITDKVWSFNRESLQDTITITDPLGGNKEYCGRSEIWVTTPENYRGPRLQDASKVTRYNFRTNVDGERIPWLTQFPDGTATYYEYEDVHGLIKKVTNRQGKPTSFTYNNQGQVLSVTDPKGNVSSAVYANNGVDRTQFHQPNPRYPESGPRNVFLMAANYGNRGDHQPEWIEDIGGKTYFTYTNWGAPETVTDPQNRATRNLYTSEGRLWQSQHSDAPVNGVRNWVTVRQFAYNARGLVSEVTDADGLKTGYEYNDLDQVTAIIHPDPDPNFRREEITYLNDDLPVVVKERNGRRTYTDYDALRRPIKTYVYDPQNNAQVGTTELGYDKNSNQTSLTDAKGNVTRWGYDMLDRNISKQHHDGTTETYTYGYGTNSQPSLRGRLALTTGTRGQVTRIGYDDNGNQTKTDYQNMPDVTMSYNQLNDVVQITDGIGTHVMGYDYAGRLVSNDGPLVNDTQTYSYDALSRVETQTAERGASGGVQSQTYAYDALGRLASLNANGTQGTGLTNYSYDGNTDRLRILAHPNGTKTDLRYDSIGRLAYAFNGANGHSLYNRYAYQHDARDVRTVMQTRTGDDSIPIQTAYYTYDALDQLKQERVIGGVAGTPYTTNYNYDAMGNRTQVARTTATSSVVTTSTPNALNQLTSLTTAATGLPTQTYNLSYDTAGNLTQSVLPNGTYKTTYSYDDEDRLARIERRGNTGQLLTVSEFGYDYASRRAFTREYDFANGGWANPQITRRVFDDLDVVQERNANNEVTAQLVRDGNIGGILSRTTSAGAAFYGYDGNGNVTLLTDTMGKDIGHYRYDAFGNTLEAVGPRAGENPYRFSTKELHGPSGLYDYGLRFYSPSMGRWLNRDPLQEEGGINLYAAMGNDPVNSVDLYGENRVFQFLYRLGTTPAAQRIGPVITRFLSRGGGQNAQRVVQSPAVQQAAQRAAQVAARSQALKVRSQQLNRINGYLQPYKDMSDAQKKAFQHSYNRHSKDFNLPAWKKKSAENLRVQFNNVVTHVRDSAQTVTVQTQPVGQKGGGVPAVPTQVRHFVYEVGGVKYYYYETFAGRFISAGRGKLNE